MKLKPLLILALPISALILLPFVFSWIMQNDYYGIAMNRPAPDFTLDDVNGHPHSLKDHRGHFLYLYFGYIHCDDVCQNQVGVMFNIHHHAPFKDVDFVFVTIDPDRDTKALLKDYFNQFGPNFYGLTAATQKEVQRVASQYNEFFFNDGRAQIGNDYEVTHPGTLFLIDPHGIIRMLYRGTHLRYDYMISDLTTLKQTMTF